MRSDFHSFSKLSNIILRCKSYILTMGILITLIVTSNAWADSLLNERGNLQSLICFASFAKSNNIPVICISHPTLRTYLTPFKLTSNLDNKDTKPLNTKKVSISIRTNINLI